MNHWATRLRRILQSEPCIVVTVGPVRGSAPREPGARMLVTRAACQGSIGGGNLEFQATQHAREMLNQAGGAPREVQMVGLGPALNQCCGGSVLLHFEGFSGPPPAWLENYIECMEHDIPAVLRTPLGAPGQPAEVLRDREWTGSATLQAVEEPFPAWLEPVGQQQHALYLFGAGHVGKALVQVLAPLPFRITWIDERAQEFPAGSPAGVRQCVTDKPLAEVGTAAPGSLFLVMTHSHELDEDICHAVLARQDFAWLGLIGSTTKRHRFENRLRQRGIEAAQLARLVCPIGMSGIRGKQPATIAVAVAAQLLAEINHQAE